jgi:selenocysteine lyase/cysteine desulfurase
MASNTDPIFTKNGKIGSALVTAANTSSAGGGTVGTTMFLAFTADATNGSFIKFVRWIATSSVAATATTATVGRIFISSLATGTTTSADTFLISETALPVVTAANTTSAVYMFDVAIGFPINPGYTILVTNHAAPASNTAWRAIVVAGDY